MGFVRWITVSSRQIRPVCPRRSRDILISVILGIVINIFFVSITYRNGRSLCGIIGQLDEIIAKLVIIQIGDVNIVLGSSHRKRIAAEEIGIIYRAIGFKVTVLEPECEFVLDDKDIRPDSVTVRFVFLICSPVEVGRCRWK